MNGTYRKCLLVVTVVVVFAVRIVGESSISLAESVDGRMVVESPLRAIEGRGDGVVTRLALDPGVYRELQSVRQVTLKNFVLNDRLRVELALERIDVFAQGARVVLGSVQGDHPMREPDILLFNGHVVGRPDSTAFLGFSPHGSNGLITIGNESFVISSGPRPGDGATIAYNLTKLPSGSMDWLDWRCMTDPLALPAERRKESAPPSSSNSTLPGEPCRVAELAIETDWEFTGFRFGGDAEASSAYAALLIGAISEIYVRDFNVELQIVYLRIWSDSADPWDQSDMGDQLVQFKDYWNANMTDVPRHLAHYLSGRSLGGGVAYLPGLCNIWWGYGLSSVNGFFPYPLQNNVGQNWDPYVVAHEIGHNFGAPHTHNLQPPIDNCGNGDCTNSQVGTIMSYCHGCPGGMANIRLEFHPRIIDEFVLPHVNNGACLKESELCPCKADVVCDDGDPCSGAETCNTETGECLPGTPTDCDDGDECNGVESCDPKTGECIDGQFNDCDGNGVDDACDLADCDADSGCDDCDGNGSLDRCDIAGGQPDVNGNGVLDQCESCTDNASCDDSEPCSFDRCIDNVCWYDVDTKYGDVAGAEGACGPSGDVDLSDILAVLDGFTGQYAEGCELVNIDIAGAAGSCAPNEIIDLSDILGVLDAFQGLDRCCTAARE